MKYYHFYANGRDVKEISEEEFTKMSDRDEAVQSRNRLLVQEYDSALAFRKAQNKKYNTPHIFLWIPKRQLNQILGNPPQLPVEPRQTPTQQNAKQVT